MAIVAPPRFMIRLQVAVFRATNGRAMSSIRGMPILLLTTIGRKSGQRRTTALMYIRDGDDYVITASNSGRDRHPAWFHNLQASPLAEIEVPGKRLQASASVATPTQRERLWPELVRQAPFFDGYRRSTSRSIPMVLLRPR